MTYHQPNYGNQAKATATGTHKGKHFKLVAGYDVTSDLYVVHVYVSDELQNPYSRQMPSDKSFKKIKFLNDQTSIEAALDAGDEAAETYIEGM
jgi:hypothetical protein